MEKIQRQLAPFHNMAGWQSPPEAMFRGPADLDFTPAEVFDAWPAPARPGQEFRLQGNIRDRRNLYGAGRQTVQGRLAAQRQQRLLQPCVVTARHYDPSTLIRKSSQHQL